MAVHFRRCTTPEPALTAISGVAFVSLLIAAHGFAGAAPAALTTPPHLVRAFYATNRTHVGLATYLAALGLTAFLCFFTSLRGILTRAEGEGNLLPQLAFAGGVTTAALALVGDLFLATLAFRASSMNTQTAWILFTLWNMALCFMALPAAILVGASCLVIVRTGVLPRWVGVIGFPLAAMLLAAPTSAHHTTGPLVYGGDFWLPLIAAFLLWVLAISGMVVYRMVQAWDESRRPEPGGAAEPPTHGRRRSDDSGRLAAVARRARVFLLVTLLLCGFVPTHHPATPNVRALLLLAEVLPQVPIKPLGVVTPLPSHTVVRFASAGGPVVADLYLPGRWLGRDKPRTRPALILALGVKVGRDAKPSVLHFAEAMSRLGYVTLWPRREALNRGALGLEQPGTFVAAFRYLERERVVDPRRISYLGFSAGASEAFVAATNPLIARQVHTVVFFGGYYSLPAYLVSLATDKITVARRAVTWRPSPAFLAEMKAILRASHQKNTLRLFATRTAAATARLLRHASPEQQALLRRLSPSSHVHGFRSTIFILHDRRDPIVPWIESRKLARALPRRAVRAVLWSDLLHHVVPGANDWSELPFEGARLYDFVRSALHYL